MNAATTGSAQLAAVGDLHVTLRSRGRLRADLAHVHEEADILLLAGDLTNAGTLEEARVLADELSEVGVPVVAVLGNHDHDEGHGQQIAALLQDADVVVLDGDAIVLQTRTISLGIAGIMGLDGGFTTTAPDCAELRTPAETERRQTAAAQLRYALARLDTDIRVALTHYAPAPGTLAGEPPEIYRYLGSDLLGEAIDASGADLAIHGHAHLGTEHGSTRGGVPVRNVALPVLNRPYAIYTLAPQDRKQTWDDTTYTPTD